MHYWPTWQEMIATLPPGEQAEIAALLAGRGDDPPPRTAPPPDVRGGTGPRRSLATTPGRPGPAAPPALVAQRTEQLPLRGRSEVRVLAAHVNESLRALRDPGLDLADVLCQLILDIRRILVHPDLQNYVKLAAIQSAVDELAPPPGRP